MPLTDLVLNKFVLIAEQEQSRNKTDVSYIGKEVQIQGNNVNDFQNSAKGFYQNEAETI